MSKIEDGKGVGVWKRRNLNSDEMKEVIGGKEIII